MTLISSGLPLLFFEFQLFGFLTLRKWHLGFFQQDGFNSYLGYLLGAEDYFKHTRAYNGVNGYDLRDGVSRSV